MSEVTAPVLTDVNDKKRYAHQRAGVILMHRFHERDLPPDVATYTDANGGDQLYFAFGVDEKTGDLTDFGGGVKSTEATTSSAWREFEEESLNTLTGCVHPFSENKGHVVVYDRFMAILFLRCCESETYDTIRARFAFGYERRKEEIEIAKSKREKHMQLLKRRNSLLAEREAEEGKQDASRVDELSKEKEPANDSDSGYESEPDESAGVDLSETTPECPPTPPHHDSEDDAPTRGEDMFRLPPMPRIPAEPEVREVVWVPAQDVYRAIVSGCKIGQRTLYWKVREFLEPCIHQLMLEIERAFPPKTPSTMVEVVKKRGRVPNKNASSLQCAHSRSDSREMFPHRTRSILGCT